MHSALKRVLFTLSALLLCGSLFGLWANRWDTRVRASRSSLAEIAARYPLGSPARAMAMRREIMRRRHPRWTDLTVSEIAARLTTIVARSLVHRHGGGNSATPTIAPFLGDYTQLSTPMSDGFVLLRQSDCSLTFDTGTYNTSLSSAGYVIDSSTPHYENTLHQLAGMTTTADAFPSGCTAYNGSMTRAQFVGKTSQNLLVFASDGYDPNTQNNALYYATTDTSYNYHSLSVDDSNPNIQSLISGDLNKDGTGDIIELSYGSCSLNVLLGKSDGSFGAGTSYSCAGYGSQGVVVGDFNGDGNPDVAVISSDGYITIMLGDGTGALHAGQSLQVTGTSSAFGANLITADTRGNGRLDIISSTGAVLLSNGDGTFTMGTAIPLSNAGATSDFGPNLAAADLNKDGKVDLVYADGYGVEIYLGNGDGTFTAGKSYASIDNVGYVTITDIDGDGNLDIYVGMAGGQIFSGDQFDINEAYVLLGNGDGTFQGAPLAPVSYTGNNLADVNGDGKMDLVGEASAADGNSVNFTTYLGQKDGSFAATGSVLNVASITVSNVTQGATTYANPGVNSYALADVNGDGRADLLFITATQTSYYERDILCVALANSDGSFAQPNCLEMPSLLSNPVTLPTGGPDFDFGLVASSLQVVDLNGDGKPDLLYSYEDGDYASGTESAGFVMQPGNGDGTFGAPKVLQLYSGTSAPTNLPQFALLTDLNGDGRPDLVTTLQTGSYPNPTVNTAYINMNNGDGTFKAATSLNLGSVQSSLAAGDMNGDGKNDLVEVVENASGSNEQLVTYLSNGDGTFAAPVTTTLSNADIIGLVLGDFNRDGKLDVVVLSYENSYTGIYFGDGDGTVQTSTDQYGDIVPEETIPLNVGGPGIAYDFDGDGKLDMLAGDVYLHAIVAPSVTTTGATTSTTSLSVSPTSASTGQAVTLTATVAGPSGNSTVPTGTVTFYDGSTSLGTETLDSTGKASLTTSSLSAGTHSLTVVYGGDNTFSASTSSAVSLSVAAVSVGTSTTLSASATTAASGTSITFTATVSAASGSVVPSGMVTFLDGSTSIGSGTLDGTGKATFSTSTLSVGTHNITANYGGSSTFGSSTSSAQTITIAGPDFSLSISPSSGSETKASTTMAMITVTPSNGFDSPVAFNCSGLPAGLSCSFNPSTVTPSGGTAATTTVTFSGALTASQRPGGRGDLGEIFVACFGVLFFAHRRRIRALPTLVLVILVGIGLAGMQGCSGSSSTAKTSTNTVTITGSSQATSHTVTYTLSTSN